MKHSIIIQNAKKVTEGIGSDNVRVTFVHSTSTHDYSSHPLSNGQSIAVDGGAFPNGGFYTRGTLPDVPEGTTIEDWCLHDTDKISDVLEKLLWGTNGKMRNEPLRWVPISELKLDHLKAIIQTQTRYMAPLHQFVVRYWIQAREQDLF